MRRILPAVMVLLLLVGAAAAAQTRLSIPGTRVSIVPLEGYHPAKGDVALLKNEASGGGISVADVATSFYEVFATDINVARLTKLLSGARTDVEKAAFMKLAGHDALLIRGRKKFKHVFRVWMLLIHAERTIIISVEAPESRAPDDASVVEMLNSIQLGPALTLADKLALLQFRLTNNGPFRVVGVANGSLGNTVFLTIGDKDVASVAEQPFAFVTYAPKALPPDLSRRKVALFVLSTQTNIAVDNVISETDGGKAGPNTFELLADAEDTVQGTPLKVAAWVRSSSNGVFIVVGYGRRDAWDDTVDKIRAVRDGIELKARQ